MADPDLQMMSDYSDYRFMRNLEDARGQDKCRKGKRKRKSRRRAKSPAWVNRTIQVLMALCVSFLIFVLIGHWTGRW